MGRPLSASRWLSANVWVPPSDRRAAGRTRPSLRRRHTFSRGKSEVRKQAGGWKKPEATEAKRRGPGRQLPSRAPPAAQGCSWPSARRVSKLWFTSVAGSDTALVHQPHADGPSF